jgi:hypothetical protein
VTVRLAHNATAAAASIGPAAWWAARLTDSATAGPLAPLGLTTAALLVTIALDRRLTCWLTRAALFVPVTALALSPAAARAALTFATGAAL